MERVGNILLQAVVATCLLSIAFGTGYSMREHEAMRVPSPAASIVHVEGDVPSGISTIVPANQLASGDDVFIPAY